MRAACAWLYVFIEIETSDGQTSAVRHLLGFCSQAQDSRELGAGSLERVS